MALCQVDSGLFGTGLTGQILSTWLPVRLRSRGRVWHLEDPRYICYGETLMRCNEGGLNGSIAHGWPLLHVLDEARRPRVQRLRPHGARRRPGIGLVVRRTQLVPSHEGPVESSRRRLAFFNRDDHQ